MSALHLTYVMLRLNRWAVWVRWENSRGAGDPKPQRVVSWMGKLQRGRIEQIGEASTAFVALCPVDISEASETSQCVRALPEWARRTVVEDYLVGGTAAQKAEALGITDRALRKRRDAVHGMLLELFNLAAARLPLVLSAREVSRPYWLAKNS